MLYALRTMASADGVLRYRDGRAIPLGEITAACRSDEKDVRDYLTAAIAAGVVGVVGERKRGKTVVYTLFCAPRPNWAAAAAVLANRRAAPGAPLPQWPVKQPADSAAEPVSSGGGAPNLAGDEFGAPQPELVEHGSGARTPNSGQGSSGVRTPLEFGGPHPVGFGGPPPDQPGSTRELHQEMADVAPQPQDVRAQGHPADQPEPAATAPLQAAPDPPPGSRVPRSRTPVVPEGQVPLLLSVPGTGADAPPGPDMGQVITDLTMHGREAALARYGGRLVARAATLAGRTGT
jgi:hypothetical protein